MASKPIIVIGSSNIDMSIRVERLPMRGETVLGGNFATTLGGKGANQAIAAARAGAQVIFLSRLGTDINGDWAIRALLKDKIDTRYIIRDEFSATGVASILVDKDGENSIAVAPGANDKLSFADVCKAKEIFDNAGMLIMQLEIPLDTVFKAAKLAANAGITTILNPAPAQLLSEELLRNISILTPNQSEAEILTGIKISDESTTLKAADILMGKGLKTLIITLGAHGLLLAQGSKRRFMPSFKVKVQDSTAAGDVFNGVLALGLNEGKTLGESIHFATAAAALCVTRKGAEPSIPWRKEIEAFLDISC